MSTDYRALAVEQHGEEMIAAAERAGVPVPFWGIEGRVTTLDGTMSVEAQFRERPTEKDLAEVRAMVTRVIGPSVVTDSLSMVMCWDPRQWEGRIAW